MKALQVARKADKMLDSRQEARFRQLNDVERLLVQRLLDELRDQLTEDNGRITSKKGFVSLANAVDTIFDEVAKTGLSELGASLVGDMKGVLKFNADYHDELGVVKGGEFRKIRTAVDALMRKRLGIGSDDGIQRKGYLDQLFRTTAARDEVKKMVAKQVAAGVPMRKLEKDLRLRVAGTKNTSGVLERHIGGFVLDAYHVADSITNNEFAKRLDLKYFIYSGGLIETSRAFCRKRNNKVFSTDEAKEWHKDPTLPRTSSGVVTDYIPLEDLGRWRCRHRLLYIPEQEARRRRPDLA